MILCSQVVFSRPVIALGSDFGSAELPPNLVSERSHARHSIKAPSLCRRVGGHVLRVAVCQAR